MPPKKKRPERGKEKEQEIPRQRKESEEAEETIVLARPRPSPRSSPRPQGSPLSLAEGSSTLATLSSGTILPSIEEHPRLPTTLRANGEQFSTMSEFLTYA
jgi:hypothetical protein